MSYSESQGANRRWWTQNPVSYDWHGILALKSGTRDWLEKIDRRFLNSAYYAAGTTGLLLAAFYIPKI